MKDCQAGWPCGLIQVSTEKQALARAVEYGILTHWSLPFRLKAVPTIPESNDAPFISVPELAPALSLASPCACHQPTSPEPARTHVAVLSMGWRAPMDCRAAGFIRAVWGGWAGWFGRTFLTEIGRAHV